MKMSLRPTLDDLIKRIYNHKYQSVWTCTLGPNQSGKTDFNLYQLQRIHALGLGDGFGSNIADLKADFEIDFIEDFETLKKRCQMLNPDPESHGIKRYFFVADEMGDWAPRDQPWLNVKFIKELQQVRKYGLSLLGSGIDRIDSRILNEKHFHGYFEKVSKGHPQFAIYYDWCNRTRAKLHDIPRTKIGFNTWYSASFFMEPQSPDGLVIPLNVEHKIVAKYLESGSWKASGIHSMEGKRAVEAVLRFHMKHCLGSLHEESRVEDSSTIPADDVS
jgi:hypothetical protein